MPFVAVLPMNTTSTAANADVAEKTSTLLASVNKDRVMENRAVKIMTSAILINIRRTKYNMRMTRVGKREDRVPLTTLLNLKIFASSYSRIPSAL